jgi:hypothetical protein
MHHELLASVMGPRDYVKHWLAWRRMTRARFCVARRASCMRHADLYRLVSFPVIIGSISNGESEFALVQNAELLYMTDASAGSRCFVDDAAREGCRMQPSISLDFE